MTHLATHNERCGGSKCSYFYYEYKEEKINMDEEASVLLVGGMHGN